MTDRQQVGAHAHDTGLRLNPSQDGQQLVAALRVGQPIVQVAEEPTRSLYAHHGVHGELGLLQLRPKLLWTVQVGSREPVGNPDWIPVLAINEISLLDVLESRFCESVVAEPIDG